MLICDGCQREFDFVISIGGLFICVECISPYDEALSKCCSERDYAALGRRVRVDILHSLDKGSITRSDKGI